MPDELHRKLKSRAALEGLSLSDYLLREVKNLSERPTLAELGARIGKRSPVSPAESAAAAIRAERDAR